MQAKKGPPNGMSSTDISDNDFELLSFDSSASYDSDNPIEILSSGSDCKSTQNAKQFCNDPLRREFPCNDHQQLEDRNQQKRRFWMIVRTLMRYLKKKSRHLHERAQNALGDCAKGNVMKDEGYTNVVESVHRELVLIVGVRYWERAEQHIDNYLAKKANERNQLLREEKLRKQRFWMQVRVLMKYLERTDSKVYKTARLALGECEKRHVKKEARFIHLVESVERELIQVVGTRCWKRAQWHVAQHLCKASNEAVVAKVASSFDSQDNPIPLSMQQHKEQTREACPLKTAFAPSSHTKDD